MTLPTYNAGLHHIGLKTKGSATMYGFMLHGGLRMEMQREAIGAPDFGGATDLIGQSPSLSRWTQDDFTGGLGQYVWGRDDAMFSDCTNFIPDQLGRSLISCPPMYFKKALDPDTQSGWVSDVPKAMFMVSGSIYIMWSHTIARYQIGSDTLSYKAPPTNSTYVYGDYDPTDGLIWALCNTSVAGDRPFVERIKTDLTSPTYDSVFTGPSGTNDMTCYGGSIKDSQILAHIGRRVYSGVPPANPNPTVAGTITWSNVGRLPGRWKDSVAYNNLIYILCNDGGDSPSFRSTVVAFDGDGILPICQLPHSFYGKCIVDYGGRIFVGGTGTDVNGGEHYAELYEITGSSVRLVRTFAPETRNYYLGGVAGEWPQSIDDMAVFEGLLWFAQKGKRFMVYDLTSDGFFGASEIQSNSDLYFPKLTVGRGRLWAFGVDPTDDTKHGIYRIAQPADATSLSAWNPTLVTSDFAYEPAMDKRWSKMTVMTRYDGCDSVEYSTDGGTTWTALTISETSTGKIFYTTADLTGVPVSKTIRFRIKLDDGTNSEAVTYHRELVAYSVAFAMLDSGKRAWNFTIIGAGEVETLTGEFEEDEVQVYNQDEVSSTLQGWAFNKTPLTFTDVDGSTYDTQIVGFVRDHPVIAEQNSSQSMPEALYSVTLLEV